MGAFQVADPPPGEFGQEKGRRHHADFLTPAASGAGNHPFPYHRHLKSSSPQMSVLVATPLYPLAQPQSTLLDQQDGRQPRDQRRHVPGLGGAILDWRGA